MQADVRAATLADIHGLVELSALLYADDAGQYDARMDINWPRHAGEGYFSHAIEARDAVCYLATVGTLPVGYAIGRMHRPVRARLCRVADLESLYVRAGHRSAGVGSRLVGAFVEWSREHGADAASATAFAANDGALRFYQRNGFIPRNVVLEVRLDD
jgi:GNAT superfamily N-acetyltransferase